MVRLTILALGLSLFYSCNSNEDQRPNILLIVADDLGYADLGCYGSDISTPNIDQLAKAGLRFSQFHTSPYCAPTRAMILSGNNNHVAGMGNQGGAGKDSPMYGQPGYEGHLSDRIIPLPMLLREAGYHTYTAGKWHLGAEDENSPHSKGFERSYSLLQGAGNHFNNIGIELEDSISFYSEDGKRTDYPEGEYSTDFYTNKLIEFIRWGSKDKKPFFAFAAYTSPHWPLQVPPDYLEKYSGKYDMGYDSLRVLRFHSLKKAGMIPPEATLPPRLEEITPWEELTPEEKKNESRKMELYAAMVENLDFHVGRLIEFLKEEKMYDNTIIIFMADNGAGAEDFYNVTDRKEFLRRKYDNSYENMGSASSFVSYGPQWAKAGAAPFNRHKSFTTEGGITAPFIIHGKGVPSTGEIRNDFFTVMDLAPTFYDIAGITYPGTLGTDATKPLMGRSLMPYLSGKSNSIHEEGIEVGLEHRGRIFYRKDNWKIVMLDGPYDENKFMLFDVKIDPAETTDVRASNAQKFEELLNGWNAYLTKHQIIIQR